MVRLDSDNAGCEATGLGVVKVQEGHGRIGELAVDDGRYRQSDNSETHGFHSLAMQPKLQSAGPAQTIHPGCCGEIATSGAGWRCQARPPLAAKMHDCQN